jgi:hypothetical protein
MRRQAGMAAVVLAALLACASVGLLHAQAGLLAALGVQESTAKREALGSLSTGYVNTSPAAKAFLAAGPAARVTMVRNVIAWAKAYTESAAFKAEYDKLRAADTPAPPKVKGTVDEELAAQRAERKKSLEEMKKNIEKMPANLKPQMEATVKQTEAQFAKMDSDPQMVAMMRQGIEMQRANDLKAHEQRIQAHDKRFPAEPKILVARRIQEFLDTTKDVDFSAKTKPSHGLLEFVDPKYEDKPAGWKICFRAGKDATAAAREAATAWLATLG